MNIIESIILGIIQGLCEFLPVSSSGHLLLMQRIFGLSEGGYFFSIMLHLGTLIAVLIVYRKRIIKMICHPIEQIKYWIYMIIATVVTVVMALVFDDVIDGASGGSLLGYCFLITAILLFVCDTVRKKFTCDLTIPKMKWYQAAIVGFAQGIAILPGISRSGATITGSTLCRMKKEDAAEFSFLLSIPAILGGAVLELPDLLKEGVASIDWLPVIIGMITAGICGYFAVRFMIRLITKRSFVGFSIYTAVLGIFVILDQNLFHLIAW